MKKTILTIGLFTLVLVSASIASPANLNTPETGNTLITSTYGTGGQQTVDYKKTDYNGNVHKNPTAPIDGTGGQQTGQRRKTD